MSPEKRSALMSRIRGKDTGPERRLSNALRGRNYRFETHVRGLPGRPDIVFRREKIVVFIDGDFWHGWRFSLWRGKLSGLWQQKVLANRTRDQRNFRKLRRLGWSVVRIWEHQVEQDIHGCVKRVLNALSQAKGSN